MAFLRKVTCAVVLASMAVAIAGCDTFDSLEFFDTKKKLPGERKPVFPEGVPGVSQGIPAELQKGYNEQATQAAPDPATAAVQQLSAKPEAKEKPKPKQAAKPKPKPKPTAAQAQTQSPPPQPVQQPQQGQSGSPWPGQ
jgi:outer membrane biosynthesis protein TonB